MRRQKKKETRAPRTSVHPASVTLASMSDTFNASPDGGTHWPQNSRRKRFELLRFLASAISAGSSHGAADVNAEKRQRGEVLAFSCQSNCQLGTNPAFVQTSTRPCGTLAALSIKFSANSFLPIWDSSFKMS